MRIVRLLQAGLLVALTAGAVRGQVATSATGRFTVVWGDPRDPRSQPVQLYTLIGDDGRWTVLRLPADFAAEQGGPLALNGARVTLRLTPEAAPAGAPGPAGAAHAAVSALERVEPTARTRWSALLRASRQKGVVTTEARAAAAAASAALPHRYAVLLCRFADIPTTPADVGRMQAMVGTTFPGVSHFWSDVSDGRHTLDANHVLGWYNLPGTRASYLPGGSVDLGKLANDCGAAAAADADLTTFDGILLQFNDNLDCCSWGGGGSILINGEPHYFAMTWMARWAINEVGTYSHEVGHSLGLPHSGGPYGRVYDSSWDVMSSSYLYFPAGSEFRVGASTIGYHRDMLGWLEPERTFTALAPASSIVLERLHEAPPNAAYRYARIPITADEFYTLETRRQVPGYDQALPGEGVIVHRVRTSGVAVPAQVVDADGNGNVNDAGAIWVPGESFIDAANQVRVTVDSAVGSGFGVSIVRGGALLAVTPLAHHRTLPAGDTTSWADSALVQLSPATAVWSAAAGQRLALAETSGTGSGVVHWSSSAAGLTPGTYIDAITVQSPGAAGSPARVADTLVVTPPSDLTLGLSARTATDSTFSGGWAFDTVRVALSGTGAASATWSATTAAPWLYITSPTAGTEGGTLRLSLSAAATPGPGLYVDTVRVTAPGAAGSPGRFVVRFRVLAPLGLAVSAPHPFTLSQGAPPAADTLRVTFQGRAAASAGWYASYSNHAFLSAPWTTQSGDGPLVVQVNPGSLAPGVYVDSVIVVPSLDWNQRVTVYDTLTVTVASATFALSPSSTRDTIALGTSAPSVDSAYVVLLGPGAASRAWTANANPARTTFVSPDAFTSPNSGTGTGRLRWARNLASRTPGSYVDTITVALADGTGTVVLLDSVTVLQPLWLSASAMSRKTYALTGSAPSADSVLISLTGLTSTGASWAAWHHAAWLHLGAISGVGGDYLRWTRDPAGLAAGVYLDTIVVATDGALGSPLRIVDTLQVLLPLAITTPAGARRSAATGAAYADTIQAAGGSGSFRWALGGGALPAGLALDSTSGIIAGTPTAAGSFAYTVRVTSAILSDSRAFTMTVRASVLIAGDTLRRQGTMGAGYADTLRATGGNGTPVWTLAAGALPPGVSLAGDGVLSGVPENAGSYRFRARVSSDSTEATSFFTIPVVKPALPESAVLDQLFGAGQLTADQLRFLDLQGNRNGRLDIGDVRAWLKAQSAGAASAAVTAPAASPRARTPEESNR